MEITKIPRHGTRSERGTIVRKRNGGADQLQRIGSFRGNSAGPRELLNKANASEVSALDAVKGIL